MSGLSIFYVSGGLLIPVSTLIGLRTAYIFDGGDSRTRTYNGRLATSCINSAEFCQLNYIPEWLRCRALLPHSTSPGRMSEAELDDIAIWYPVKNSHPQPQRSWRRALSS